MILDNDIDATDEIDLSQTSAADNVAPVSSPGSGRKVTFQLPSTPTNESGYKSDFSNADSEAAEATETADTVEDATEATEAVT